MSHPSLGLLFGALAGLLVLAAFFAGSETALMSLNRYRLRHRANEGHRGARLAEALLAHPDRLIGLILLLSTIVNVTTPMLVGYIALRMGGHGWVVFGAVVDLEDQDSGARLSYQIVGEDEADLKSGRISVTSPAYFNTEAATFAVSTARR